MAPLVLELRRRDGIDSPGLRHRAAPRDARRRARRVRHHGREYDLDIMRAGADASSDITSRVLAGLGARAAEPGRTWCSSTGTPPPPLPPPSPPFTPGSAAGTWRPGCARTTAGRHSPEEMNRRLAGQLCTLHFAPTARNAENLRREGVEGGVFVTGNTVIDALGYTARGEGFQSPELRALDLAGRRVVTPSPATAARITASRWRHIFAAVREIAARFPDVLFVYPVHLSPAVRRPPARRPRRRGEHRPHRAALRRGHAPSDGPELHGHDRLRRHTGGGPRPGQARARASAARQSAPRPWRPARSRSPGRRRTDIVRLATELLTDTRHVRAHGPRREPLRRRPRLRAHSGRHRIQLRPARASRRRSFARYETTLKAPDNSTARAHGGGHSLRALLHRAGG